MSEKLNQQIQELRNYIQKLVDGDLSAILPSENDVCPEIRALHANLNHMAWQAKRVSDRDYKQFFTCFGKDSDPFNMIVHQLRQLEYMEQRMDVEKRKKDHLLNSYNLLLRQLTDKRKEFLIVIDANTKEIIYCNQSTNADPGKGINCEKCKNSLQIWQEIVDYIPQADEECWESETDNQNFYKIYSYPIEWNNVHEAYIHVVEDITEQRIAELHLEEMVFEDTEMGVYNRRYFDKTLKQYMDAQIPFSLCYIDMDELKQINDKFGHGEGDIYIKEVVDALKQQIRQNDVMARLGGDEFGIIFINGSKYYLNYKMETLYDSIHNNPFNSKPYHLGFSFGIVEYTPGSDTTPDELMEEVETVMRSCKTDHKKKDDLQE